MSGNMFIVILFQFATSYLSYQAIFIQPKNVVIKIKIGKIGIDKNKSENKKWENFLR